MDGHTVLRTWRSAWAVILGGALAAIMLLAACTMAPPAPDTAGVTSDREEAESAQVFGETSLKTCRRQRRRLLRRRRPGARADGRTGDAALG
jgi:hypothetical protein